MTLEDDSKRIKEILREGLSRESIAFDFEAWKTTHQEQVANFRQKAPSGKPAPQMPILQGRCLRFALAACLIVAAALVLRFMPPLVVPHQPVAVEPQGPAAMMNRLQLTIAYTKGGIEALEEQYDKAYAKLGPRAGSVSVNTPFYEFD